MNTYAYYNNRMRQHSHSNAVLSLLAALWGSLLFGLNIGYTAPIENTMKDASAPEGLYIMDKDFFDLFAASLLVGCAFGSLLAGQLVQKYGRRLTLVGSTPAFLVSYILMATTYQPGVLLCGRFLSGLAVGVCSVTTPMYIAEIAPASLRGAFGASNQLAIVVGIALAYFLGLLCITDGYCNWRTLTWCYVAPTVLLCICMLLAPESPRFLASKGKLHQAKLNLQKLRGGEAPAEELATLAEIANSRDDIEVKTSTLVDLSDCRKQLIIGVTLQILQQFSGINAVMFYMTQLFKEAGFDAGSLLWSCLTAALQIFVTLVACVLMDKVGRRSLLLIGSSGLALSLLLMGIAIHIKDALVSAKLGFLFVVAIFGYITFFSIGVGAIPWLILSEIFPDKTRAAASAIATTVNWSCAVIITSSMSSMTEAFGMPGLMWFYATFCGILAAFTFLQVPETKGRSFEEIQAHFDGATSTKILSAAVTSPGSEVAEEKL